MKCLSVAHSWIISSVIVVIVLALSYGIYRVDSSVARKKAARDIEWAQAKAQILYIEAQAQRDANLLISGSLTPSVLRLRAIEQWDGKLPEVIPGWRGIMPMINIDIDE